MSQYTRGSREKESQKLNFIDWLLCVKPFESMRSLRQFAGYYIITFAGGVSGMKWGIDSALTLFLFALSAWWTIDYYREYKKKTSNFLCVCVYSLSP